MISDLPFDDSLLPERKGVYLVGGTVRDMLLGLSPADYDIAVSRNPEKFARLTAAASRGRLIPMGRPGKTSYRVIAGGTVLDITGLNGPTIGHDLETRDITINAMAIDLDSGALVDQMGGRRDLAEKRIRMVSDRSFTNDPIRLLRVFRLAAVLGFSIESRTTTAIRRDAALISESAGERIHSELQPFLSCKTSFPHVLKMAETGLLTSIFPEIARLRHLESGEDGSSRPLKHILSTYGQLEELLGSPPPGLPGGEAADVSPLNPTQSAWLKCAALLHPLGKPSNCEGAPPDAPHPEHSKKTALTALGNMYRRLRLSNREQRLVTDIVLHHDTPLRLYERHCRKMLDPLAATRLFMTVNRHTPHLLLHALAEAKGGICCGSRNTKAFSDFLHRLLRDYCETYLEKKALPPLITGRDLMTVFRLSPSAGFRKILTRLEEERLAGNLVDRESALMMAREMIREF